MTTLEQIFNYHAPHGDQVERYEFIRNTAKEFAKIVLDRTPESHERNMFLERLRESVMWANASIAINESQCKADLQ